MMSSFDHQTKPHAFYMLLLRDNLPETHRTDTRVVQRNTPETCDAGCAFYRNLKLSLQNGDMFSLCPHQPNKKNISHESGVVSILANTSPHHNDLLILIISCAIPLTIVSYPPSKTTEVSNIPINRPPFCYLSTAAANILRDVEDPSGRAHDTEIVFGDWTSNKTKEWGQRMYKKYDGFPLFVGVFL